MPKTSQTPPDGVDSALDPSAHESSDSVFQDIHSMQDGGDPQDELRDVDNEAPAKKKSKLPMILGGSALVIVLGAVITYLEMQKAVVAPPSVPATAQSAFGTTAADATATPPLAPNPEPSASDVGATSAFEVAAPGNVAASSAAMVVVPPMGERALGQGGAPAGGSLVPPTSAETAKVAAASVILEARVTEAERKAAGLEARVLQLEGNLASLQQRPAAPRAAAASPSSARSERARSASSSTDSKPKAAQNTSSTASTASAQSAAPTPPAATTVRPPLTAVLRAVYPPSGPDQQAWVLDGAAVRVVSKGSQIQGATVIEVSADRVRTTAGDIVGPK